MGADLGGRGTAAALPQTPSSWIWEGGEPPLPPQVLPPLPSAGSGREPSGPEYHRRRRRLLPRPASRWCRRRPRASPSRVDPAAPARRQSLVPPPPVAVRDLREREAIIWARRLYPPAKNKYVPNVGAKMLFLVVVIHLPSRGLNLNTELVESLC